MNKEIIINEILNIPIKFYDGKTNDSFQSVLESSQYFEHSDSILEDDIANLLIKNDEIMNSWLMWSENKRTTEGWFFKEIKSGFYSVGKLDMNGKQIECLNFNNKRNACAVFIKREIDSVVRNV